MSIIDKFTLFLVSHYIFGFSFDDFFDYCVDLPLFFLAFRHFLNDGFRSERYSCIVEYCTLFLLRTIIDNKILYVVP